MGKTMAKANVIWGEQHSVSLASFSSAHMANIVDLIQRNIGPNQAINHSAAQAALIKAKNNPKMKNGYVKVGLIGTDLVLRCKEKKFLGDIEFDAVLVKSYPNKMLQWDTQQQLDKLEKGAKELMARKTAERIAKAEREKAEAERAKAERLHQVMNTPDAEGKTMRTKILSAAKNAQKLGVGDYAKNKLKAQGLTPMDERYHGEAIDPKNRYGRHMPPLRALWEKHASQLSSFGKWLDEAEAGKTDVPGVREALALKNTDNGRAVIEPGGVAGGRVIYLDDTTRKPYEAKVTGGAITGTYVKNGEVIFVIGSDNKIYAGTKARAAAGERKAFNHSSFFSGGPVKSAGTLIVAGGKITDINDLSGHYTPSKAMVTLAVRKFGGKNTEWLNAVNVKLGTAAPVSGAVFLGEAHEEESAEIWGKYSAGNLSREDAAKVLLAASDGNWLVRVGSKGKLVISYRKGSTVTAALLTDLGKQGLDRKNLLLPKQVNDLLVTVRNTPSPSAPGNGESEQEESETQEKTDTRKPSPRSSREIEQQESETQEKTPKPRQQKVPAPKTQPTQTSKGTVDPVLIEGLRQSRAWHGDLNRAGSETLLNGQPGSWLLREGTKGLVAFSYNEAGAVKHILMNTSGNYAFMTKFSKEHADGMITA